MRPDRSIFRGKRYLPIGLVEAGRGCHFKCDFCAVQTVFSSSQTRRPADEIVAEIAAIKKGKKLFFFVDDNITSNFAQAKEFLRELIPLGIRWVGQASINAAHDEEFLELLVRSGCQGVLIGFESLNPANLAAMNKTFNTARGGFPQALANLRRHKIRVYGTFVFGYDHDTADSFEKTVDFAEENAFYIAAFNHLTPFPGTPLYRRLAEEGRLLYEAWWLDDRYSYNQIPFVPRGMSGEELQRGCLGARRRFYSWKSIAAPRVRRGESCERLHVAEFFPHQRHASRRREPARPLPTRRRIMAGAALDRELSTRFAVATRADDAAIRRLLRENPMRGAVSVGFEREPDYFRGADLAGGEDQTIVASSGSRLVCMGRCTRRECWVDGTARRVGYLAELRLDAAARGRFGILRDGYEFFHALQRERSGRSVISQASPPTIDRARRLLENGARGLPVYVFLAELDTLLVAVSRRPRARSCASRPPRLSAFPICSAC